MRSIIYIVILFVCHAAISQKDTIVVADLTEIMLGIDKAGRLEAVPDLNEVELAGFFLEGSLTGDIRLCNPEEVQFYVNGRLLDIFSGCAFFELEDLQKRFESDTLFISVFANGGMHEVRCENVIYEKLQVVRDNTGTLRSKRYLFNEFLIIVSIVTLLFYAWIISSNQARRNYLWKKAFSFKESSYEFVNTTFLNQSNLQFLLLLSLIVGLLYCAHSLYMSDEGQSLTILTLLLRWVKAVGLTFFFLFLKYVFISMVSLLFRLKKMNDFQLFDYENFMLILLSVVLAFFLAGYAFFEPLQIFIQREFKFIITFVVAFFIGWFGLKIVNNSTGKKLQIIAYICATELIPSVLLYIEISK